MEVIDKPNREQSKKEVEEAAFLLTNGQGGYVMLSPTTKSRFEGVFFRLDDTMHKVIADIRVHKPVTKVIYTLWHVARERNGLEEQFFMPLDENALVYELSEEAEVDVLLDCKEAYDDRVWGRVYEVNKESGCIVVSFKKQNEEKEPAGKEYSLYLAVASSAMEFLPRSTWEKQDYPLDQARHSSPFERYVFNAFRLKCKDAVFYVADNKRKAIKGAKYVLKKLKRLKRQKEEHIRELIHRKDIPDGEIMIAYQCAHAQLDSLIVKNQGVMAGLPWFFQFWIRDELISLKALMSMGYYDFVKRMLLRNLDLIEADGTMPNQLPNSDLKAADAVGWLFKRWDDFIDVLEERKLRKKYLPKRDWFYLTEKLRNTVSTVMKYHTENGLIVNGPRETWMDSSQDADIRDGARIEIQALTLAMFKLLRRIDKEDPLEKELKTVVRDNFFDKKRLADGKDDFLARPNIFIAYYVYPELLTNAEWEKVFDSTLPKLWLGWGGLSSIDKSHPLFQPEYTGQTNESYHRGDSWFWVNNMAAMCMHRLNKKKYERFIKKIVAASVTEILHLGVTGHAAEVSSAKKLRSQACLSQAWSAALFIELIDELYP